jgi:hypothetical protein
MPCTTEGGSDKSVLLVAKLSNAPFNSNPNSNPHPNTEGGFDKNVPLVAKLLPTDSGFAIKDWMPRLAEGDLAAALVEQHPVLVRCAFFDKHLHSRMPLVPTHVRLKRACV